MEMSAEDYRLIGDQINTNHINWLNKNFYEMRGHGQIWGDEANWTKYHAACWSALRNDSWVNMGFSPKTIAQNNAIFGNSFSSESEFAKTTSAYSALIDLLTLGGRWGNPMQIFDHLHVLSPEELGFSKRFVAFWYPMMNELGAWMNSSKFDYLGQNHPFEDSAILRKWDLNFSNDEFAHMGALDSDAQEKWKNPVDGTGLDDCLHLSLHSLKPLQPSGGETKFAGNQDTFSSMSYSDWAYRLLNSTGITRPTLIRVDVQVHFAMDAQTTLGHFLLSPGRTQSKFDSTFPLEIRYVNDMEAMRVIKAGEILM